ncbi:hypothetical protein [Staphylospora marina]|uniref:hypothetical protein n=1 Tax=Staphylospora marina TaxID=2490858 RepID=UPI000F5BFA63|nr:hypothetical protein [Staphylospora marina]
MQLSPHERSIIIRALTKVLETEPPYARADEYKKVLDRLIEEHERDTDRLFDDFARSEDLGD